MGKKYCSSMILIVLILSMIGSSWVSATSLSERRIESVSTMAVNAVASIQVFCNNRPCGTGSGFVVDAEGLIITNYHVIAGADRISVQIGRAVDRNARLVAANKGWDLALLKIDGEDLPALALARNSQVVRLGETVVAVGDPEGLRGTVSTGIVSALRSGEELGMPTFQVPMIQTTAAISQGSSGGPLLNLRGEVIGVNYMMYVDGQNLNFALPVDFVHSLLQQKSMSSYEHQLGDLAVILEWEGEFDLDLEIWSEERNYIGNASWLGGSPDIFHGEHGAEWFVFQEQESYDFSRGRFVISSYFYGPDTDESAWATLTVFLPDGSKKSIDQELYYLPPYDQWLAVEIDVDQEQFVVLDVFESDLEYSMYEHAQGELAVVLQWKGPFDLDLEIWSEDFEYIDNASWIGESPDIFDGDDGSEWFVFRKYTMNDFSSGRYIVSPYFVGPETQESVLAVLTVYLPDGIEQVLTRDLFYHAPYDQWFAALVDVDAQNIEILDFFLD